MSDDDIEFVANAEVLPTKELLRIQRKKAYEAGKLKRKQENLEARKKKELDRKKAQEEKDKTLWNLLTPANQIQPSDPD
jgi:hypothetical protein